MLNDHIVSRLVGSYKEQVKGLSKFRTDHLKFNRVFDKLKEHEQVELFNELFKFQGERVLEDMENLELVIHLPGLGKIVLNENTKERLEYLSTLDHTPDKDEMYDITKRIYSNRLKQKIDKKRIKREAKYGAQEYKRSELNSKR